MKRIQKEFSVGDYGITDLCNDVADRVNYYIYRVDSIDTNMIHASYIRYVNGKQVHFSKMAPFCLTTQIDYLKTYLFYEANYEQIMHLERCIAANKLVEKETVISNNYQIF